MCEVRYGQSEIYLASLKASYPLLPPSLNICRFRFSKKKVQSSNHMISLCTEANTYSLRPRISVVLAFRETTLTKYILKNIIIYDT